MRPPTIRASLAIAIMLVVPFSTASAQDGSDDLICDLISINELNTLSSVRYESSASGNSPLGATCQIYGDGSDRLELGVSEVLTFDGFRDSIPGGRDLVVNDHPAYSVSIPNDRISIVDHWLLVDFGDQLVTIQVVAPEASVDLDGEALAMAIADVAAGRVLGTDVAVDARQGVAADDAQLGVPDVDGIEWGRNQDVMTAEEMIDGEEVLAALWQPMFDATGAEPSELLILNVRAFRPGTTDELGFYGALRIVDVDENALRTGFIDFLRNASGGDVVLEDINLGGRDVQRMAAGDEISGVLYFDGDTAHSFTMPEEDAARVIEALP